MTSDAPIIPRRWKPEGVPPLPDISPEEYIEPNTVLLVPTFAHLYPEDVKKLITDDISNGEWNIKALKEHLNNDI